MTADSQLVSRESVRTLVRGKISRVVRRSKRPRSKSKTQSWIDGPQAKRVFDILFSITVLVAFSPLYLLLALLVYTASPGPVFYVQERIGRHRRPFKCFKFRTMVVNAEAILPQMLAQAPHLQEEFTNNFKLRQDPRITWIGKFLRVTSLDEFPQFWNVLRGDMSVVGPRPLVAEELPRYGHHIDKILTKKPGITCIWQVSGRNDIPYDLRIKMDLYYAIHRTFWLDFLLICRTLAVVLLPRRNGAY